jgi:hypothetical protein
MVVNIGGGLSIGTVSGYPIWFRVFKANNSSADVRTAHDDAAGIFTLSTIDGLADHASELSHPYTITPMLPTTQSNYITAPAATY